MLDNNLHTMHELSLDSSDIIQEEFRVTVWSQPRVPVPAAPIPLEINQHTSESGDLLLASVAKANLERWEPASACLVSRTCPVKKPAWRVKRS